jgi:antitoxin ParD1/3/4
MPIQLTPSTESLVQDQIDSGRYRDADEVIRKAVALLVDRDQEAEEFRRSIEEAFEAVERGEGEYYTPALRERIWESAMRRMKAGETPSIDVMP